MPELSAARRPRPRRCSRTSTVWLYYAAGRLTAIETALGQHHADVQAWEALADDLAPDGIPRGNGQWTRCARSTIGYAPRRPLPAGQRVAIDADMQITIGGRAYALGSESVCWRADAAIADAVAVLSGVKVLVIDRMDVLDLPNRATFMG